MNNSNLQKSLKKYFEIDFGDKRLRERLLMFVESRFKHPDKSILGSSSCRSQAKAFYRLINNDKLDITKIINSVRAETLSRMCGKVLLIQDTTEINLHGHKKTEDIGYCSNITRGIRVHSCIAISPEGVPFGLLSQSYETREEAKSPLSKHEKSLLPIEDKESFRWIETLINSTVEIPKGVHFITICDREGDIYEFYSEAIKRGEDFIIRAVQNRRTDENEKILTKLREAKPIDKVMIHIPRNSRKNIPAREVEMEIAYAQVNIIKPTKIKDKQIAPQLPINLVRITEIKPQKNEEKIEWILATNLPLSDNSSVMEIVEHYTQRWKIERFHYVLKSGLGAEKIQQRSYETIKPVLLIYSVIALYILSITYMSRVLPDLPCTIFFDDDEWQYLYRIIHKTKKAPKTPYSISEAVAYLGELGSYKRAPSDGPPGVKSIWNGLLKLYIIMDALVGQG